jgi:hypothetical protein
LESLNGRDHSEDQGVNGRIILKWIKRNRVGGYGLDSSGSEQGPVASSCENGNELPGSIKGGIFLD